VISGFIGFSIFLFLSVFEPFHLWNVEIERRYLVALGYGLIAFIVVYLNHIIAYRYLKTHLLTVKGLLVWYILNTFFTGLFSAIFNDIIFNWKNLVLSGSFLFLETFLIFQYWIFALFSIPSIFLIVIVRSYRIKSLYLTQIDNNQKSTSQKIIIHAENPANDLEIETSNLIYITSANNYVDIFYLKEKDVKHVMLRNTLKNVEEDLQEYPNFCRCHKGYIVDLKKVIKISSGVSGLKLRLNEIEDTIPVSRALAKIVRGKLKLYVQ